MRVEQRERRAIESDFRPQQRVVPSLDAQRGRHAADLEAIVAREAEDAGGIRKAEVENHERGIFARGPIDSLLPVAASTTRSSGVVPCSSKPTATKPEIRLQDVADESPNLRLVVDHEGGENVAAHIMNDVSAAPFGCPGIGAFTRFLWRGLVLFVRPLCGRA